MESKQRSQEGKERQRERKFSLFVQQLLRQQRERLAAGIKGMLLGEKGSFDLNTLLVLDGVFPQHRLTKISD